MPNKPMPPKDYDLPDLRGVGSEHHALLAYIITAYTDPKQFGRLVRALDFRSDFFVHIDEKCDQSPFIEQVKGMKNVHFTSNRFHVNWGSFAQVLSQRELLRSALLSGKVYKRVTCLSGTDYPIWSNERILMDAIDNEDVEYISGINISKRTEAIYTEKVLLTHPFRNLEVASPLLLRVLVALGLRVSRVLPWRKSNQVILGERASDVFFGSDYWSLSYECAKLVHHVMSSDADFMEYFRKSFAPSEMVAQTIVFNSVFAKSGIAVPDLGVVRYEDLAPLHHIDYKKVVRVFADSDFDLLVASGKMFFRKCRSGESDKLVDRLEALRSSAPVGKRG